MAGAFFIVLAVFDLTVATLCIGGAKELMDTIRQIMDIRLNIKIASDAVILSVFASLVSWISIVVIADMAVILSASVLAGKKGKRDRGICTVSDPFLAVQSDAEPGAGI
ncbi:MAG: hypothetical protein ACLTTO_04810 [Lachnospiraceae bacterium]